MPIETLSEIHAKETAVRQHALAFEEAQNAVASAELNVPKLEARVKKLDAQTKLLATIGEQAEEIPSDLEVTGRASLSGFLVRPGGNVRFLTTSLIAAGAEVLERQRADAVAQLKAGRERLATAKRALKEFD